MPNKKLEAFRVGSTNDRRRKLTEEQRHQLFLLKGHCFQRQAAEMFGVSRRLVSFIWNPERYVEEQARRKREKVWLKYHNKERHTKAMARHRAYKKELMDKREALDANE